MPKHIYTKDQIETIEKLNEKFNNKELTKRFNEIHNLDLTTRQIVNAKAVRNIKTVHFMDNGFKKGYTPWNKGTQGITKANETSFKKGKLPHNTLEIGSERLTKDGYIEVKFRNGYGNGNWKGKQIITWEKKYGSLPEGCVIMFGDGDTSNLDIDNLLCVSRKQLIGLNKDRLIQDHPELTRIAINIVDLNYKISERSK